jgi:hypothetical protein
MRTYQETRTVCVGEWFDAIDDDYDWTKHGDPEYASKGRELILEIAANPELYRYSPCLMVVKDVLCAGMYDGWPFWHKVPAIGIRETLNSYGIEAVFFYELRASNVYRKAGPVRGPQKPECDGECWQCPESGPKPVCLEE